MTDTLTRHDEAGDSADNSTDETKQVAVEKHPRAIRWMHWLNFPFLSIMIWSGLRIAWASDFRQPRFDEDRFLPESVWQLLDLDRALARGLAFHLSFGWFFVINGALYALYLAFSGEWREIVPKLKSVMDIPATLLHELGLKKEAPAAGQYNVMQQLAYSTVLAMGAVVVITGFALFKPVQLSFIINFFGGYETTRTVHFWVTIAFLGFFLIHIAQVARAGFTTFWAMVTGYEIKDVPVEADND